MDHPFSAVIPEIEAMLRAAREERGEERLADGSPYGLEGTPALASLDDVQLLQVLFLDMRYHFAQAFIELTEYRKADADARVKIIDIQNARNRRARRHSTD